MNSPHNRSRGPELKGVVLHRIARPRGLWIFLFAWCLTLLTAGWHLASPDGELYFRTTESLATFRGLAIEPLGTGQVEVATETGVQKQTLETFGTQTGLNGLEYSQYGIGLPLVAVPFYWISRAVDPLAPPIYAEEAVRRSFVSLTNTLVTAFLALFVYRWTRRLLAPLPGRSANTDAPGAGGSEGAAANAATITALLFVTATYAWPQAKYLYSEPLAALFLLASLYVLHVAFGSRRENALLLLGGTLAGLAILTRLDSGVAGLGFLALLWIPPRGEAWQPALRLRRTAVAALPVLAAIGIFAWMNTWRFGSPLATGYGDQAEGFHFSTPLLLGLHGLLFSTGRGMFIYSPLFLLMPLGLWWLFRTRRPAAWCLALLSLGYLIAMAKWQNWEGGWCWGPRHIYQLTPFWAIPLGCLFARGWRRWPSPARLGFAVLVLVAAGIQFVGVSQDAVQVNRDMGPLVRAASLFEPEYSPIRFHAHRLLNGDHDFGISIVMRIMPAVGVPVFLLAAGGLAASGFLLWRSCRDETQEDKQDNHQLDAPVEPE